MSAETLISMEEAARLDHYCDICKFISLEKRPRKRRCVKCGEVGYAACCFEHGGKICQVCRDDIEERLRRADTVAPAPKD